jgi:hypothetical protein
VNANASEDVPTVPHRVGPMRFEAMRKVGARAAGARGVWREEAGVVAPAGSRAGHPLALRLVVRASSTFWRGLSRLQWRRFSTMKMARVMRVRAVLETPSWGEPRSGIFHLPSLDL